MATLSLSGISTVMSVVLQDQLQQQFREDVILPNLLRITTGAGPNVAWSVKLDGRTAGGPYAEGADMADGDFDSHTRLQATLNWAQYRKGAKVSGLAKAVAASIGGTSHYAGLSDLLGEEIADAVRELGTDFGGDLYAGDHTATPTELAGAALGISATDDNFAGIDTGVNTSWLASVGTSFALADTTFELIRTNLFRPVRNATGRDPHFVTVPGNVFDVLRGKFSENAETLQQIRTFAGNVVGLEQMAGARAISLDGVPFIEDRHCTANTMYAWNADMVEIVQLPADVNTSQEAVMAAMLDFDIPVTEQDVVARLSQRGGRLTPVVQLLGSTGDNVKAFVKLYAQMKWKRRNAFAKVVVT